MATVTEQIKALIQPSIEALGFELWGVQHASQGSRALLRIFIESTHGVSIDDCERVSRQVSSILDVEGPLHKAYVLEISSPGLERSLLELSHYQRCIGKDAKIKLTDAIEDRRSLVGKIIAADDNGMISIEMGEKEYQFSIDQVHSANLIFANTEINSAGNKKASNKK